MGYSRGEPLITPAMRARMDAVDIGLGCQAVDLTTFEVCGFLPAPVHESICTEGHLLSRRLCEPHASGEYGPGYCTVCLDDPVLPRRRPILFVKAGAA